MQSAFRLESKWHPDAATLFDADVFTLAGAKGIPEAVIAWRSLLRSAGRPTRFTLVSDGTITPELAKSFCRACMGAVVVDWQSVTDPSIAVMVGGYAKAHPLGRKLAILMSMKPQRPTLFMDTDILYFPSARQLNNEWREKPRYMPDCKPSLDLRMLEADDPLEPAINSGFLMMTRPLAWTTAISRYPRVSETANFFTEQTVVHLAVHASGGEPLDGNRFLVTVDDQFGWKDQANPSTTIARHYVGPVRHKMWNMAARLGLLK